MDTVEAAELRPEISSGKAKPSISESDYPCRKSSYLDGIGIATSLSRGLSGVANSILRTPLGVWPFGTAAGTGMIVFAGIAEETILVNSGH